MEAELISLFFIALSALICPILSSVIPNKIFPETVFLLILGMVLGPHVLNLVEVGDAVNLLSDLGLGFLFLLAGYEIDVKELSGKGGRHGLVTWIMTFVLALAIMIPLGLWRGNLLGGFAAAILLTTTAFGTLLPILKERGLDDTVVGKSVVEYGIWGELCPVLAMAILLTTRATWLTILLLVAFLAIAVIAGIFSKRLNREGAKFERFVNENAETNSQMSLRAAVLLLIALVTVSAVFNLDIVLGAFAAGFVLRVVIPEGDESLEHKLNGLSYGFFIPLFFIVSGTKIDPVGVLDEPLLLVIFIIALLFVRAIPIYLSLSMRKDTREMEPRVKASISLYCTTALPLIVAVTSVAVTSGAFSQQTASVLIAAGGITVLLMPLLAYITMHTIDAELLVAAKEIAANPQNVVGVLKKHRRLERERNTKRRHLQTKNRDIGEVVQNKHVIRKNRAKEKKHE